jgi:hypothetical protein
MKKQSRYRNEHRKTRKSRKPVGPACDRDKQRTLVTDSGSTARKAIDGESLAEMLFQQRIDSFQSELRRGSLLDFIEVLNFAANHASRSMDDRSRLPQWLLLRLSDLLEFVFLAPHPPGWFGKVRRRLRQRLLDLVRFQAVVKLRSDGHNVEDAFDLASQDLRSQGYEGGDEAVRWSYKRILKGIRDVEVAIGNSGIVRGQDFEKLEAELASRKASISVATSKAIGTLRRRAQFDKLGSTKARPEVESPPNMRLSLAEALLLSHKVLPGTEYLKRVPSEKDGVLASLVNDGNPGKAAMAFAVGNRKLRGILAFGLEPGKTCKVDNNMRALEPGVFFFIDRGLAFPYAQLGRG